MREKLTLWQRSVLAIMYGFERDELTSYAGSPFSVRIEFTRRALEELLLFDWQAYHTRAMVELEELGWITTRLKRGVTAGYVLKNAAVTNLWQNRLVAAGYTQRVTEEELSIPV